MRILRIVLLGALLSTLGSDQSFAETGITIDNVQPVSANSHDEPLTGSFSMENAVRFLDSAALDWTKSRKCFTCHTNYAYLMARPSIGHDTMAHRQVRTALEDLVNVRWQSDGPRWDAEVVMSAMVLAFNDACTTKTLHDTTRKSLDRMWTVQKPDGGFDWLKCDWPPMESDDHYGATVALIAAGMAPGNYLETDQARTGVAKLKEYLRRNPAPTLHHSAMVLWAASSVRGILEEAECRKIIDDLINRQKPDGGWCLASLGNWKRSDGKEQDTDSSDGYATGFVIYVLRQAGLEATNEHIQRGIAWLKSNQRESGRWYTRSVNSDGKHFISHAGTAFAVLALAACEVQAASPKVSAVVGRLTVEEGGKPDDQPGPLNAPFGVDFDRTGNMFINELTGGRVFKLDSKGTLTQIAGDGTQAYFGDGGPASNAKFNGTHNVAVSPDGTLYIADSWNHCVRKIDPVTQVITTFAGTGKSGYSGDGGPASKAEFHDIMCITFTPNYDRMYLADIRNKRIRMIDMKTEIVITIAGNGSTGIPKDGALAVESPLIDPRAVAIDKSDNVYIAERTGHTLRVVDRTGRIHTVVGSEQPGKQDGDKVQSRLNGPKHLCVDDRDNVFIADDQNHLIRMYDPRTKQISTILGHKSDKYPVQLKNPHGVCIEAGFLYVVDSGNNRVLRVANEF